MCVCVGSSHRFGWWISRLLLMSDSRLFWATAEVAYKHTLKWTNDKEAPTVLHPEFLHRVPGITVWLSVGRERGERRRSRLGHCKNIFFIKSGLSAFGSFIFLKKKQVRNSQCLNMFPVQISLFEILFLLNFIGNSLINSLHLF